MVTVSFAEIFAGDIPRIDSIIIFPEQAGRLGLAGSTSNETQISGNHCLGFNIKRTSIDGLVEHFKIENPVLITRRGGGFTIEYGRIPDCFRKSFSLEYCPSFREESLPQDNEKVLEHITEIKDLQARTEHRGGGWNTYCMVSSLWGHTKRLNKVLNSLGLLTHEKEACL